MDLTEQKIINILTDLKHNHNAIGLKVEFEDEGASYEEAFVLRQIAQKVNLDLTVKIGGCGALNDIRQIKNIGVKSIVAPMIESAYAVKKFVQAVNKIYSEENLSQKPDLFINIETISGYKNFDEIISIDEFSEISGIVIGRFDLAKSIGLGCNDIHSGKIFELVNNLALKCKNTDKIFTVGGGVRYESLDFFTKLPQNSLHRFETRKIIFDANPVLEKNDFNAILKAIEFEIAWLECKENVGIKPNSFDSKRIEALKSRCEKIAANSFCEPNARL